MPTSTTKTQFKDSGMILILSEGRSMKLIWRKSPTSASITHQTRCTVAKPTRWWLKLRSCSLSTIKKFRRTSKTKQRNRFLLISLTRVWAKYLTSETKYSSTTRRNKGQTVESSIFLAKFRPALPRMKAYDKPSMKWTFWIVDLDQSWKVRVKPSFRSLISIGNSSLNLGRLGISQLLLKISSSKN